MSTEVTEMIGDRGPEFPFRLRVRQTGMGSFDYIHPSQAKDGFRSG